MLEAGRALDALIAEKFFGLQPILVNTDMEIFTLQRQFLDAGDYYIMVGGGIERLPDYSTDIRDAWQLVEAPRILTLFAYMEVSVIRYHDRYECHIENDTSSFLCIEEAPTAPLAICRAALAALRVSTA